MLILFLTLLPVFEAGAVLNYRTRELEGYNLYSEKKEMQEEGCMMRRFKRAKAA